MRVSTCVLITTAALACGCTTTVTTSGPPPPALGAAIMQWTVAETAGPGACESEGAATFHVSLYNSAGGFAGEWVQDCTAFATTIDGLLPDDYTGQADLLDGAGNPRTTTVSLQPFAVIGNASVTVAIDFPANSFY